VPLNEPGSNTTTVMRLTPNYLIKLIQLFIYLVTVEVTLIGDVTAVLIGQGLLNQIDC